MVDLMLENKTCKYVKPENTLRLSDEGKRSTNMQISEF